MEKIQNVNNAKGHSSRRKRVLIEQAIKACSVENMFNRYKICEKIVELMMDRYSGGNLEYHTKRMGMESTAKILTEIDNYFYRDFQGESLN